MRIVLEIVLWVVGLALVMTLLKGFGPLSALPRMLLSPPGLIAAVVLTVLILLRRRRKPDSSPGA